MSSHPRIYLDHAATTPIRPEAKAAMIEGLERWANPSSPYAEGRAARAALEEARWRVLVALGFDTPDRPGMLYFTSGASEAIDIAARGVPAARLAATTVEHDAVLRATEGWLRSMESPTCRSMSRVCSSNM